MDKIYDAHDNSQDIIREDARVDQTGEIFTPTWMVKKMLDDIPEEYWSDKTKTFLEPSAGDGNFVMEIYHRLMEGLKKEIPDEEERKKHIIENQIYAVEIMEDNYNKIIDRLGARNLNHNIVNTDSLAYNYSFGSEDEIKPMFNFNHSDQIKLKAESKTEKKKFKTISPFNF